MMMSTLHYTITLIVLSTETTEFAGKHVTPLEHVHVYINFCAINICILQLELKFTGRGWNPMGNESISSCRDIF
jgi:hypothetical protein